MDTLIQMGCTDSITLKSGDMLVLKLPAIEATGYIWQVKTIGMLEHLNATTPDEYEVVTVQPEGEPLMVGKAVRQVLRFRAKQEGVELLELSYARPFGQKEVADTCRIKVVVQKK